MDSIANFVVTHKPQLDFAWHLFIYLPLILRPSFFKYFTSSKPAKYAQLPHIPLVVHMILGLAIVGRYQVRALVSSPSAPKPESLDIALGVMNAVISWRLCKYESKGNPRIVRTGFQVMALMVLFPAYMCYMTASPVWYHSMVKMHNAFIYVRWLIMGGSMAGIWSGFHELYTISVFFGGILGVWEGRYPWDGVLGVPLALVLHVALVVVERYNSSLITPETYKSPSSNPFLGLMLLLGLVDVQTYKDLKCPAVPASPTDEKEELVAETKE
ncbi:uncharacterized protein LY89DRAFT_729102 [Mollisia scopiformis]|uniref:Uncharacterized protein n=1 Tax=Mollisia scopiformis TaxID=149040 RepID=A0A194XPC3_MOLSC|nr:uncharacterized protein LY89DRAFT_729102 [Mollisia scopiformis]KUJ21587.1 hypothetical protein LY89DRAFT_729102 [Mollisia scopiformis]